MVVYLYASIRVYVNVEFRASPITIDVSEIDAISFESTNSD